MAGGLADPAVPGDLVEAIRTFFSPIGPYASVHVYLVVVVYAFLVLLLVGIRLRSRGTESARDDIPVTVGGFGTRARAEVEEMKATLFGLLGHPVVSSTGGSLRYQEPGRLDRPLRLDGAVAGATAEDRQLELAREMGARAFLWENTTLHPDRPSLFRHDWFDRGISTITSLYADGQTVKGPTAWVLAEKADELVPAGATCITAEERMLPFIRDAAREQGASLEEVDWRDAAMIPRDLLARFPYRVRPESVAMLMRLAEQMDLDPLTAAWDVAGSITPGPEAPRLFPEVNYLGRRLRFASAPATDRRGFLEDWRHLGFDRVDPVADAGTWVVVAAEADDRDRAQLLARILVRDIRCHRLAVLGDHPTRLVAAVRRELEERLADVVLLDEAPAGPREPFVKETLRRFGADLEALLWEVPTAEACRGAIRAMLRGIGLPPDLAASYAADDELSRLIEKSPAGWEAAEVLRGMMEDPALERAVQSIASSLARSGIPPRVATRTASEIRRFVRMHRSIHRFHSYLKLNLEQGDLSRESVREDLNEKYRDLIRGIFEEKIWVAPQGVEGDEVIDAIARIAPPGFGVLVLGTRTPGRADDLAARFVSLERVAREVDRLEDPRSWVRFDALKQLASYPDYGVLDAPLALEAIGRLRSEMHESHVAERADEAIERIREAAEEAREHLDRRQSGRRDDRGAVLSSLWSGLAGVGRLLEGAIETGIDLGRVWWLRRRVRRTLTELAERRIGYDRAVTRIRAIARSREPGWMRRALRRTVEAVARRFGSGRTDDEHDDRSPSDAEPPARETMAEVG